MAGVILPVGKVCRLGEVRGLPVAMKLEGGSAPGLDPVTALISGQVLSTDNTVLPQRGLQVLLRNNTLFYFYPHLRTFFHYF